MTENRLQDITVRSVALEADGKLVTDNYYKPKDGYFLTPDVFLSAICGKILMATLDNERRTLFKLAEGLGCGTSAVQSRPYNFYRVDKTVRNGEEKMELCGLTEQDLSLALGDDFQATRIASLIDVKQPLCNVKPGRVVRMRYEGSGMGVIGLVKSVSGGVITFHWGAVSLQDTQIDNYGHVMIARPFQACVTFGAQIDVNHDFHIDILQKALDNDPFHYINADGALVEADSVNYEERREEMGKRVPWLRDGALTWVWTSNKQMLMGPLMKDGCGADKLALRCAVCTEGIYSPGFVRLGVTEIPYCQIADWRQHTAVEPNQSIVDRYEEAVKSAGGGMFRVDENWSIIPVLVKSAIGEETARKVVEEISLFVKGMKEALRNKTNPEDTK